MLDQHVTPQARCALLAALHAPTHTLRRVRGVFIAMPHVASSGPAEVHAVTKRMALRLEREGLVDFDDPMFPTTLSLNERGLAIAEQLQSQADAA